MAVNIRSALVEFEQPTAPNYRASNILTQKIYPTNNVIGSSIGVGGAFASGGELNGNLEFLWSVPSGHRMDVSRSYIMFDTQVCISNGGKYDTAIDKVAPAFNFPAAWFTTGRLELNDTLVSQSNNIPQDDTMFVRLTNSYAKYTTNNSNSCFYGSDTQRRAQWLTNQRQQLNWAPSCLLNPEMVLPENLKCHMILQVNPTINSTPLNSPAFVAWTGPVDAAGAGRVLFYGVHMVATYVKIETPTPSTVFIPAYNIKSTYQQCSSTNNNLQFTIGKDVYKVVVALNSSSNTILLGQSVTKFSSGTGAAGTAQSTYSAMLTGLQLNFAGQQYPASMYNIDVSAGTGGTIKDAEPYCDYLGAVSALQDSAGSEAITVWRDPIGIADVSFGRIFPFNIVRPSNDMSTTAELTLNFSAVPGPAASSTRAFVFGVEKTAYAITYSSNKQIQSVSSVPFN